MEIKSDENLSPHSSCIYGRIFCILSKVASVASGVWVRQMAVFVWLRIVNTPFVKVENYAVAMDVCVFV